MIAPAPYHLPYTKGQIAAYQADTGVDILMPAGSPVILIGLASIEYSEGLAAGDRRHTPWVPTTEHPTDTPGCVRARLARPVHWEGRTWTKAWYAHLSRLALHIRAGIDGEQLVALGQMIGHSGIARGVPHLHFGLIDDDDQGEGHYCPPASLVRWLVSIGGKAA